MYPEQRLNPWFCRVYKAHMKIASITAFISSILLLSSCTNPRLIYAPDAYNVPVLREKGNSKLAAYYSSNYGGSRLGTKSNSNGTDLQGAYAFTSHLALQANYFYRGEATGSVTPDIDVDSSIVKYKRNLFEFGAGYYTAFTESHTAWFQVFAGAGFGEMNFTDRSIDTIQVYNNYYKADVSKIFVQPAFMYTSRSGVALSLVLRGSVINLRNIQTNYSDAQKDVYGLTNIKGRSILYIEPGFIGSYAFPHSPLRLEMQLGLCIKSDIQTFFASNRKGNFSFGAMIDFSKLYKKK